MSLYVLQDFVRRAYFSGPYHYNPGLGRWLGVLLGIFLVGIVTAVGLVLLKAWARGLTLFLATAPLCFVAREAAVYRPNGWDYTPVMLDGLLIILIPVSIWWWIVFTRKSVRAQFR